MCADSFWCGRYAGRDHLTAVGRTSWDVTQPFSCCNTGLLMMDHTRNMMIMSIESTDRTNLERQVRCTIIVETLKRNKVKALAYQISDERKNHVRLHDVLELRFGNPVLLDRLTVIQHATEMVDLRKTLRVLTTSNL
jgi:hypothetical protein